MSNQVEDLSYEQAFGELELLVRDLETDELALERALELYERGQALAEHCGKLLEKAELKLRTLQSKPDEEGEGD